MSRRRNLIALICRPAGWGDIVDPALFSQGLMYYASQSLAESWPGEPESDPTIDHPVKGSEIDPRECMDLAHINVLRDSAIEGGEFVAVQCS